MFSKACEYAIRAVIYIFTESMEGTRVGIRDIAKNIDAPEPFVAKVLQMLSRRGIIASVKGPNGGFFMEPGSRKTPLIEVVRTMDGDHLFVSCGLGIKNCSEKRPCPIHHEYKDVRERIIRMLKKNTIEDLATGLMEGESFLVKK